MTADPALTRLFRPRDIALVGVSEDPRNLGHRYLRHLLAHGFPADRLQVVHPRAKAVLDIPAVPAVEALDGTPDLALVLTAGGPVPELLDQLVERGVPAFNVFANDGPVLTEPDRLRAILARRGARLLGPNSPGFVTAAPPVAAHASQFLNGATLRPRPVAVLSHSGAIGGIVAKSLLEAGAGFTSLICTGNELDLGMGECLRWTVAEDEPPVVAGLFVEHIRDLEAFRAALELAAERGVRVCALKVGWSEAARRAARMHSGAVTGRVDVFAAELGRTGATLCRDLGEMTEMLAMASLPRPGRGGVAIAATSGGLTSVLGDAATAAGLDVPELAAADNPWDTDIQVVHEPEVVGRRWVEILEGDDVGAGIMALSTQPDRVLEGLAAGMASGDPGKPCVVVPYAGIPGHVVAALPAWSVVTRNVPGALRALAWLSDDADAGEEAAAPPGHVVVRVTIGDDPDHGRFAAVGPPGGEDVSILLPAPAAEIERCLRTAPPFAALAAFAGSAVLARIAEAVVAAAAGEEGTQPVAVALDGGAA